MNEMRKLMEAAQLNEYGSNDFPENVKQVHIDSVDQPEEDGSGNWDDWHMEFMGQYDSVDWKAEPEHVLAAVAEQIAQYGLGIEIMDAEDDGTHFRIKKWK